MYLLYSLLLTFGVIALLPRFLFDAFRHGKYVAGLSQRLGRLPPIESDGRKVIWLHCVSVGETLAARPLARALLEKSSSHILVISTTTLTGQRIARESFLGEAAAVFYFPFDWAWTVRRALRAINPSTVLIMETELWPNFLRECRRRGVSTAIVNGRLSERSFRRYRLISRFAKRIVSNLDLAIMQSEQDAQRVRALGLAAERVHVAGNVKFDVPDEGAGQLVTAELRQRFGVTSETRLIVAASTHHPEERVVLEAFKTLRATEGHGAVRLLIAPRHPERFSEVATLLQSSGLSWARRTGPHSVEDSKSDAILLDSIGELRAAYPLATVVFVGGSISPTGGHNVVEPAAAGASIVTGAHTENFRAIIEVFLAAHALVQLPDLSEREAPTALSQAFQSMLDDEEVRGSLTENARRVLEANRGATVQTIDLLAPVLAGLSDSEQSEAKAARRGPLSA